jgi:hypothetical protein
MLLGLLAVVAVVTGPWLMGAAALAAVVIAGLFVLAVLGAMLLLVFLWCSIAALKVGAAFIRHRRRRRRQHHYAAAVKAQSIPGRHGAVTAEQLARLPADARLRVERIRRKAQGLLEHANQFPAGSGDHYLVQRMLDDYLPSTLTAYLTVSPAAVHVPVTAGGQSATQLLDHQLGLLEGKLDEVTTNVLRADVERLLANGRFLEEHVTRSQDGELTIPRR